MNTSANGVKLGFPLFASPETKPNVLSIKYCAIVKIVFSCELE